jgi:hypothetical protein
MRNANGSILTAVALSASIDPARNVFVIIQGTTIWAYRYHAS